MWTSMAASTALGRLCFCVHGLGLRSRALQESSEPTRSISRLQDYMSGVPILKRHCLVPEGHSASCLTGLLGVEMVAGDL